MPTYLLTLSIGPVQDFIAAARKTRDLWYGSALLSDTARHVAWILQERQARLIFPAPSSLGNDSDAAIPNKIVAIVDGDPASQAQEARQAAQRYLREKRDAALAEARKRGAADLIKMDLLDEQLDGFLEFFAAWWPCDEDTQYQDARTGVEALLAGRKALRDFEPAKGRDGVPKSALDGGREAVIRTDQLSQDVLRRLDFKRNELLDGISLIKRLAPRGRQFVSVSRVAFDPLVRRLDNQSQLGALRDIAAKLASDGSPLVQRLGDGTMPQYAAFPFDTELFYNDGSGEKDLTIDEKNQGERFYEQVRALCKEKEIREAPAYLAILAADGDHIGRTISTLAAPDDHITFSEAGVEFARIARATVEEHHGALVYSGGDDVLAFLPLDTALECAKALSDRFGEIMHGLPVDNTPTLSVGIAIGHYNEPLQDLLAWARAAEQAAKSMPGKNALAVALHMRSGGAAVTARHSWVDKPLARWNQWIDWFKDDVIPDGAVYELRTLARELRALAKTEGATVAAQLVTAETARILGRKKGQGGTQKLKDGEIAMVTERLRSGTAEGTDAALRHLESLVNEMLVARQIASVRDIAEGRRSEERAHDQR